MTSLLARRERDLYETSVLHNTLEMKAKKDDTESQAHVLEYANRNNELTQEGFEILNPHCDWLVFWKEF